MRISATGSKLTHFVFASPSTALQALRVNCRKAAAKQSRLFAADSGLPRRFAPRKDDSQLKSGVLGFTLIELMVVITIIGIMSAAVIFNLPDPRGNLVDEAERFAARTLAVRDEAVTTARETRVRVTQGGYGFDQRQRGQWAAITSKPLADTRWTEGTIATPGDVIFDPTGLASEDERIVLTRDDVAVSVTIGSDGSIRVGK